jgi:uncharacterized protein
MGQAQFWVFVASTLGVFIAPSLWRLSHGADVGATMSTSSLLVLVAIELVLGLSWSLVLSRQGWTLGVLTESFAPSDLVVGMLLFAVAWVGYFLTYVVALAVAPGFAAAAQRVQIDGHPELPAIMLVCAINPIAEEFLYLGVLVGTLRRQGTHLALAAAVVSRVAVHLYQGPLGILGITPGAVLFAAYYLANRRIWPVVVAHTVLDLLAFGALLQAA